MLSRIAHHNGTRMPDTPLAVPASATGPSATLLDTFRSPELRRRMCVMMVCWFIVSLAYYGVSLALESLEGSLFVNFFLISLIEFPSYFVTIAVCPPPARIHECMHRMQAYLACPHVPQLQQAALCRPLFGACLGCNVHLVGCNAHLLQRTPTPP